MEWFKKHADGIATVIAIFGAMIWMSGKFNTLEKDIVIIKTVLIMKDIMPRELAIQAEEKYK